MEQTVYADVLFAVNFSMDFLALYITAFIVKNKFRLKRGIAAAAVGGLYGVFAVVIDMGMLMTALFTLISGVIMCLILSGFADHASFIRKLLVFLVANLAIGGGMTAVYNLFNKSGVSQKLLIYGELSSVNEQLPLMLFAIGGAALSVIMLLFGRSIAARKRVSTASLFIEYERSSVELKAIVDTGDMLVEPLSGRAVAFISRGAAERLLPDRLLRLLVDMESSAGAYPVGRIRFLVCETIGGKKTVGAFKPDTVRINGKEVVAWIAIADGITALSDDGAIIPAELSSV